MQTQPRHHVPIITIPWDSAVVRVRGGLKLVIEKRVILHVFPLFYWAASYCGTTK